jgi:indolepyruvate ferredoxin oxidoreductase beta subunit
MPVASGTCEYPKDIERTIKERFPDAIFIDAIKLALEAGHIRSANVVLLGAVARFLPIEKEIFKNVINKRVPPKTVEINLKAFELGFESVS